MRPTLLVFFMVLGMGCGPVQSTAYLLDAAVQLEAARTAQAEKYAPYEWTAGNLYLHKAREEVGYSDFEEAVAYADKAKKLFTSARDTAMKTSKKHEPAHHPGEP